ncbi:hypothetical protein EJ02DRAFT_429211 [Clathrospora elynae]|uniref:Uncharacterized protein n=1 Tax=Clathrospora elynae TaxID=706981 RepID=A0A6A5S390_9PLEO|nr:hypothetical protein EJ02DRAFT_429211 [Clathrospora elynae]
MFITAWEASFKEKTILKAFEATGLSPFEPETESLLQQVVKDRRDPQVQKLSQAFHSISVQKSLLEQEANGLKEALINERLRRKRGKALPLEAPKEYHGGAVVWSPSRVNRARDCLQQQEAEEEQRQLQKAEAAKAREARRQAKAQDTQARRQARAEARISREKEKAKKASEQASRAAACRTQQQLQNALRATQKGNRMSFKAPTKAALKKKVAIEPQAGGTASGAAAGAPPSKSQHDRAIKLPAKYR